MTIAPSRSRPAYHDLRLPSVDRTIDVLEVLARSNRGLTLSELSRKLGIPKSTAHYMLYTLLVRGYLQRESDGRHYRLGLRVSDLAGASSANGQLALVCSPYVQRIAKKLCLTAMSAVRSGAQAVIITRVESLQDDGAGSWVGRHLDLHCTSQGKVLVAYLSDQELNKVFGDPKLAYFTPKTIRSLVALKAHLAQVKANGYAVNDEEHVLGIRAVAAPIFDYTGAVLASLSVRGSTTQIAAWRLPTLGQELISAAEEITRQLCELGPYGSQPPNLS